MPITANILMKAQCYWAMGDKEEEMKPKRYVIVEVPEGVVDVIVNHYGKNFTTIDSKAYDSDDFLAGPVELMQAACEKAGVVWGYPKYGDMFFSEEDGLWLLAEQDFKNGQHIVIPAQPEPCPNCQGIKPGVVPSWKWEREPMTYHFASTRACAVCGRPESEWTYAPEPDWAGIGSGIM